MLKSFLTQMNEYTIKPLRMKKFLILFFISLIPSILRASEVDLPIPDLKQTFFLNSGVSGWHILLYGFLIILIGVLFGIYQFIDIKKIPAHNSMLTISKIIYETCKTYLIQQGKFLIYLFLIIGSAITFYFLGLVDGITIPRVLLILLWTVFGILGSYGVAWFGIRINTLANSRASFAALKKNAFAVYSIPLQSGMSIGLLLVSVELILMLIILLFIPRESAGACLIGFAIGESLSASALRIAGGIFTKIADIGADMMKIVFKLPEDDPRNPGVIADCTGDNAGDSVGPSADGFETYGVTGVALISFIVLAISNIPFQGTLIVWIFAIRIIMILTSLLAYYVNHYYSKIRFGSLSIFDFEIPLTNLVWITSILSIIATYIVSFILIGKINIGSAVVTDIWWKLATIISFGTLAAAIIPEFTKAFTSTHSRHVNEIVIASREGGASLNIMSGMVAGNFSAFWKGMAIVGLMTGAYFTSKLGLGEFIGYPSVFAFGLVAFGFLSMGPVTVAVDSYGPVTDNAQSVFELSRIEHIPGIKKEIENDFGFTPDFEAGKNLLEANDSAGNTFKATAKPVLIGTAVIGATTMIFSIILLLKKNGLVHLELTDPQVLFGFITGGAVIYWITGSLMQAVTTGAYRAVEYIKKNINLDLNEADMDTSKEVVKICTLYAQSGMWNIFAVIFCLTLSFAFFDPNFFVTYLISIAIFGLFQAMYMANTGGAWDNAKKIVEVRLKEKNTPLHDAMVVGDTVGDPYKDTSSVALNPIIKFSTLFGLLAAEIAIKINEIQKESTIAYTSIIGSVFLVVGLYFVYRSFYSMRIEKLESGN
jgi:K(+)-stimulated pyrophosphate-energized sodium pump